MVKAITVSRILYLPVNRKAATICLCDQNPELDNAEERRLVPYLVLLREEFTCAARLSAMPGGLLPHHFTLTPLLKRYHFCCTGLSAEYGPQHPSFQKDSLLLAVRTFLSQSLTGERKSLQVPEKIFRSLKALSHLL